MADNSDDLDELLDSALDDFNNLNLTSTTTTTTSRRSEDDGGESRSSQLPLPCGIQGLGGGGGLPDLRSKNKKKGKQKAAVKENHVLEAFEKLREQTKEAVRELESTAAAKSKVGGVDDDDLLKDGMIDDWAKQFEDLAGTQDMESMVESMMQQLLSKEILHEPMKEIAGKYPKWLEENQSKLSKDDHARYSHQYELIKELNEVYEKDPSNFQKIVELMQKMQECGQPPSDIVQALAPDLDLTSLGQLSPDMLDSQPNCCIM